MTFTFNALASRLVLTALLAHAGIGFSKEVDFNRDIRPILSDKCFHCHGPDADNQKSDYRLDSEESAYAGLDGYFGIVPGNLKESEVHWRIRAPKGDIDVMPPEDSNRSLTEAEKDLLDAWMEQGAKYDTHWSFKQPVRPALPKLSPGTQKQVRNPIDHFIFAPLEAEGLKPSPEASLENRIRRAALTLTGLPPTVEMLNDTTGKDPKLSYAAFIDERLQSFDFAERQTLRWLDAARYADTDGYQNDAERKNWPWRDWVIGAFHDNMPFDQFTIEQLAGDMIPDATPKQILASAFNRNHRQNSEGGALADEFFVENVIDRVETTSTVWLGLTMGCARCHDHKYDPLSQREFFQMFAYFNNIGEKGIGKGVSANPTRIYSSPLMTPPPELVEVKKAAEEKLKEAQNNLSKRSLEWAAETAGALNETTGDDWTPAKVTRAAAGNGVTLKQLPDESWLVGKESAGSTTYSLTVDASSEYVSGISIDALPHDSLTSPRKLAPSTNGNFVLSEVRVTINDPSRDAPIAAKIKQAVATYEQDNYPAENAIDGKSNTGWAVYGATPESLPPTVSLFLLFEEPFDLSRKATINLELQHTSGFSSHHIGRFRINLTKSKMPKMGTGTGLPPDVLSAIQTEEGKRSPAQKKAILQHYRKLDTPLAGAENALSIATKALERAGHFEVPVMVMEENAGEPVPAYLLNRGQYDAPDKSEALPRAVPAALFSGDQKNQPGDRLELARWLVSKENPITARVVVNRIWRDHFGTGIVKTVEDFGAQSEYPSHPDLLDWLAVELVESGWNIRALHRLIVTSATFQQSAKMDSTLLSEDPDNRLLARGPRYRMDGFAIRDSALQSAGLLDSRVGGAPVKPYQPEGLWNVVAAGAGTRYQMDKGEKLYRKSLYTYWKRAVNPPRQLIFDSSGREACSVSVSRTNTPLQALVLMNDVTFIEAAKHAGLRALAFAGDDETKLNYLYRTITASEMTTHSGEILKENLKYFRSLYSGSEEKAKAFLSAGEAPLPEELPKTELAAWTAVAHLLLNLDKTITVE
ncbi:MAG: PSD1 and planctomycete cytochrome C domain-containing protein [Verrucomicrobiales bacterium]|nr:PSD1 and planctomycete cytochrome C domain-containing protein [Verrucomicrobiales bacterium]